MNRLSIWGLVTVIVLGISLSGIGCQSRPRYFRVGNTTCMSPTLKQGQLVKVKPVDTRRVVPRRFEIVVFYSPVLPKTPWVMRVVGLPGDHVRVDSSGLSVNELRLLPPLLPRALAGGHWLPDGHLGSGHSKEWRLLDDEIFVVGDNLATANDSRYWGPLKVRAIIGVVDDSYDNTTAPQY